MFKKLVLNKLLDEIHDIYLLKYIVFRLTLSNMDIYKCE